MTDVVSFVIGTMLNSGGEPDHNHWAPKSVVNSLFQLNNLGMTWPCDAVESTS